MSYVLVLLVAVDIVIIVVVRGVPLPSFYIQGRRGYKESHRVPYNCSPSKTLSLVFPSYKI
jgi:hypothetical protein